MAQEATPIFDKNSHVLTIDENLYKGDEEMLYILKRLNDALSDKEVRHYMNMEDEYLKAIRKQ